MNAVEKLLDLKAALMQDGNEAKTFLKALFDKVLEKINIIS